MPNADEPATAIGAASLSSLYAWAALGIVVGVWCASHPTIDLFLRSEPTVTRALFYGGFSISILFTITSWVYVFALLEATSGIPREMSLSGIPLAGWFWRFYEAVSPLLSHGTIVVPFCSLLCGVSAWTLWYRAAKAGEGASVSTGGILVCNGLSLTAVPVAFLMGVLQPVAWEILLPHSSFPQPLSGLAATSTLTWWKEEAPGILLPFALMVLLGMLLSRLMILTNRSGSGRLPYLILSALCVGLLAFRLAGRIVPSIYMTPFLPALSAALAYAVCVVVLYVMILRELRNNVAAGSADSRERRGPVQTGASLSPGSLEDLRGSLTVEGWNELSRRGLSKNEILVMCAHVCGLDSATTAHLMGIKDSSVREYRSRCRRKLGVRDLDDVLSLTSIWVSEDLRRNQGAVSARPAAACPPPIESRDIHTLAIARALGITGLVGFASLVLLPFEHAIQTWSDVWAVAFGSGAGLIAAWAAVTTAASRTGSPSTHGIPCKSLSVGGISCFVASAALVTLQRLGLMDPQLGHAPQKMLVLMTYMLLVSGITCLLFTLLHSDSPKPSFNHCQSKMDRAVSLSLAPAFSAVLIALGSASVVLWAAAAVGSCLTAITGASMHLRLCTRLRTSNEEVYCNRVPERCDVRAVPPMSQLLSVLVFAWTWEEVWRAQRFENLLLPLAPASLVILIIFLYCGATSARRSSCRVSSADLMPALCIVACTVETALCLDLACALMMLGLQAAALWLLSDGRQIGGLHLDAPRRPGTLFSWHSPLLAAAFGACAGAYLTNAYGYVVMHPRVTGMLSDPAAIRLIALLVLSLILLSVVTALLLAIVGRMSRHALLPDMPLKKRAYAYLESRGLSAFQIDVALLLLEGRTVNEVAQELNYSISAVHAARSAVYKALGVQTRKQFVETVSAEVG